MRNLAIIALLWALLPAGSTGQPAPDTVLAACTPVADFVSARALAADPLGQLYVVDGGPSIVYRLGRDGAALGQVGGQGVRASAFDEPRDVDPTNGLVLLVADAGGGRIHRYSKAFAYLGALAVPRGGEEGTAGRPVAVAAAPTGEVFAVEEDADVVLQWDDRRRLARIIGGYEAGEGTLVRPVALAVEPGRSLFVADAGRDAVLVYDLFGSYARSLARGVARDVQALTVDGDRLWIVLPHRLLIYATHGRLERVVDVALEAPLVGAAHVDGVLYLLTPMRLYRAPW